MQAPAAGAAPIDLPAAADSIFEATGVPVVDELMRLKTVEAAAQFTVQRVALIAAGALLGMLLLRAIDRFFGRRIEQTGTRDLNIVAAAAAAAFKPIQVWPETTPCQAGPLACQFPRAPDLTWARLVVKLPMLPPLPPVTQVMLPFMSGAYVLTLAAALAQVAAVKMKREFYALCRECPRQEPGPPQVPCRPACW